MHVAFVCNGLSLDGGSRFIFQMANGLVDRGFKVTLLNIGHPKDYAWFKPIKAEVKNLVVPDLARALGKYYLQSFGLFFDRERLLAENMPDCDVAVATAWPTAYNVAYCDAPKKAYLVQHYEPSFYGEGVMQNKAAFSYQLPLVKFCVSQWLTEKVHGEFIGNGIDLAKFQMRKTSDAEESVMLCLRRQSWKNNDALRALTHYLKNYGVTLFTTNETVSDEQLIYYYQTAKVFVNLSEKEGFGYSPLEAMGCGAAVVSTRCCEYLTEENATLVNSIDVKTVGDAVLSLLKNPERRQSQVKAGLETAKQYDFNKVINKFASYIQP